MKTYSIEQRSIFDKPYISVNVANLELLDTLRQQLSQKAEIKNVNISQGKRLHLSIYGQSNANINDVYAVVKEFLDGFDDSNYPETDVEQATEYIQEQNASQNINFTPPKPQYMNIPEDCPTVFISHAWDGESHKQWILKLANELIIKYGINVLCDYYNQGGVDLVTFMMHGIKDAHRVLIIGTPKYKEKSECLDSNGVSFENMVMSSILYDNNSSSKFIPILKEGDFDTAFNSLMSIHTGYDLSTGEKYNSNIETLARDIWNEPLVQKPNRGAKPNFNMLGSFKKTEEASEPIWKKLVLYEKLEPTEFEYVYCRCWDMLVKQEISSPIILAHLVSVFAELHSKNIILTDDKIKVLKANIDRLLTSTGNKDALYDCCITYAQTLSANHYNEDDSDLPKEMRAYFNEREKELWSQLNYRLVNELEHLNDSNVSNLMQIHQTAPDHGTAYSSLPLFKYVDIEKMVSCILSLSSQGRTKLADFFIDRYMLYYGVSDIRKEWKEDLDGLKELQVRLGNEITGFSTIQKLSYYKLANAITSAFKRCEGDKKRLV